MLRFSCPEKMPTLWKSLSIIGRRELGKGWRDVHLVTAFLPSVHCPLWVNILMFCQQMAFCRIFVALLVVNTVLLEIIMFCICWYFHKVSLMALESSITWLQRNKSPYSLITSNITAANISWEAASCVTKWLSMMKLLSLKAALLRRLFHSGLCYICCCHY